MLFSQVGELNQKISQMIFEFTTAPGAGLSLGLGPLQNGELGDWETMIDTNIKGLLYVSKVVMN